MTVTIQVVVLVVLVFVSNTIVLLLLRRRSEHCCSEKSRDGLILRYCTAQKLQRGPGYWGTHQYWGTGTWGKDWRGAWGRGGPVF